MQTRKNAKPKEEKVDAWEPFDDCPICQAMVDGRASTLTGLREAFAQAKREGKGIVFSGLDDASPPTHG